MFRLLLVEDDPTIGQALESSLRHHSYDPRRVTTGSQALAEPGPFDLVLLDLGLPDIDGLDVCRHLRATQPHWGARDPHRAPGRDGRGRRPGRQPNSTPRLQP